MNSQEQSSWLLYTNCEMYVAKEFFHHHAYEIINTHSGLKNEILSCLSSNINIESRLKKTGNKVSKGIKADLLNVEIRKLLKILNKTDIKLH